MVVEWPDNRQYRIGGQRENGVWIWQGHYTRSIDYSFWNSGHTTDKDCITIFRKGVRIRDDRCISSNGFRGICETGNILVITDML